MQGIEHIVYVWPDLFGVIDAAAVRREERRARKRVREANVDQLVAKAEIKRSRKNAKRVKSYGKT